MVDRWATSASLLVVDHDDDDDPLFLLPSSDFDDDDPSSYLLYPPGFGPVEYWVEVPGEPPHGFGAKGGDLGPAGGRVGYVPGGSCSATAEAELGPPDPWGGMGGGRRSPEGSGEVELGGLSDALSGELGISVFSSFADCGWSGVDEYMISGNSAERGDDGEAAVCISADADVGVSEGSAASVIGEGGRSDMCTALATAMEDGIGVGVATMVASETNVQEDGGEETNLNRSESSEREKDHSSSSSSSSSSGGEEHIEEESSDNQGHDDVEVDRDGGGGEKMDEIADLEEGEIRHLDADVAMSDDSDDGAGMQGPIRSSKIEIEALPPVPSMNAPLEQHHHILPVGVISSIIGNRVIVEGLEKHKPLSEGSILWITETRSPLGFVDEIFGSVKNPSYAVRYNSEKEIPPGISEGADVSFVILTDPELCKKGYNGYDKSDQVVGNAVESLDKERETEYKRSLLQVKRGTNTRRHRNQEPLDKKRIQFDERRAQSNTSCLRKDARHLASCISTPCRPPCFQDQFQAMPSPSCNPRQMQAPPQTPYIPDQHPAPPWQPLMPGQLQAPNPLHWVPGQHQAPTLADNDRCGSFTCFLGAGQASLRGAPIVHTVSPGGQPGSPIRVAQHNLLMQQSNAAWAMGLSTMLPVHETPCHQLQDLHAFLQHPNQAFQHFTDRMPFQHQFSLNQGVFGFPNGFQNCAQFQPAMGQGDMHTSVKSNFVDFQGGGYPFGRTG